ncbi:MAG: KH domain-containing protein [bacterium]|nr:KH domain-containing protein [bacterium]
MDNVQVIGNTTQELLSLLKITAKVAVSSTVEEDQTTYTVEISGDNLGILIGYHGETLTQLQQILSLTINKKLNVWTRIIVDVNEWRLERKETVESIAKQAMLKAKQSGLPQELPSFTSYERRLIHSLVSLDPEYTSHSEGEGINRKLVIQVNNNFS